MDRISQLANDLSVTLDELHDEAARLGLRPLIVPLAWLDEANGWLRYELSSLEAPRRDPVPFTYVPLAVQKQT
jgi:hypothetical protein